MLPFLSPIIAFYLFTFVHKQLINEACCSGALAGLQSRLAWEMN